MREFPELICKLCYLLCTKNIRKHNSLDNVYIDFSKLIYPNKYTPNDIHEQQVKVPVTRGFPRSRFAWIRTADRNSVRNIYPYYMIILSASILNVNVTAMMKRSGRWKLVNKRRLPACGSTSFLDPLLLQYFKTQERKS